MNPDDVVSEITQTAETTALWGRTVSLGMASLFLVVCLISFLIAYFRST